VTRPVIRLASLPGDPAILTRVIPDQPSTSILLRLRPGWANMALEYLSGEADVRATSQLKLR
jgi:hypothetical protein